ncbi:ankyrin repeat-containing domain protein [Aspergillus germanicus]
MRMQVNLSLLPNIDSVKPRGKEANSKSEKILDNLQTAVDNVASEKDKETLNNLYLAADHLSDLTLFLFTNCSVNQQALKGADISAETAKLVMDLLGGLASVVETVAEFSQVLCGSAGDDSDDSDDSDDDDDDGKDDNITTAIVQEYASTIADIQEGIERFSKLLDVMLCLTQIWLDVEYGSHPYVLGQSLEILQQSIVIHDKAVPSPSTATEPSSLSSRLSSTAHSIHSSISAAHPHLLVTTTTTTAPPSTTTTTTMNLLTSSARNLFHTSICTGDHDEVQALLDAGMHAMAPGPQGLHPIHYAAFGGHLDIVRLLVRYGADAWAVVGPNRETPLMYAAAAGKLDVVRFLVEESGKEGSGEGTEVDVDCVSEAHGATALLCACDHGHLEVARFLAVEKKADPFRADKEGCSPLIKAVNAGHKKIVEMLLEEAIGNVEDKLAVGKKDENVDDDNVRAANRQRDLAAARAFLEKGANVGKDKTPVQTAIGRGMEGVVEYLLSEAMKVTNLEYRDSVSDEDF